MIKQAVGRVADGPHHGELVVYLGQIRQKLGEIDSRQLGFDGLEDRTNIGGRIRFWIPQIQMARATLQVKENNTLGLAPAWTATDLSFLGLSRHFEHAAQGQAEHTGTAHAQDVASGHAEVIVAEVFAAFSG